MISFLRDTWVYLPERGWSKINAATAYGGTGLLINTLNENFDLDIQNYIQIKFNDFKQIIDIIFHGNKENVKKEYEATVMATLRESDTILDGIDSITFEI